MAFTLPLIGDLADLGLNDFQIGPGNARKIRGYVRTNLGAGDALIDTTNQVTLLGDTPITILSNGTWSVDLLDTSSTDLNVEANTLQYELVVEYTSTGSPAKRVYRSGWFALTEADLELVEDVPMAVFSSLDLDLPSVTPGWRSAFVASMEAIATTSAASATSAAASADAAATIVGLTGEDAAVALLIDTPASDTATALSATIAGWSAPDQVDFVELVAAHAPRYKRARLFKTAANGYQVRLDDGVRGVVYGFIKDTNDDFIKIDGCYTGYGDALTHAALLTLGDITGTWNTSTSSWYTTEVGATFTKTIAGGDRLDVRVTTSTAGGMWSITVDGGPAVMVSTQSTNPTATALQTIATGLDPDVAHTVVGTFIGNDPGYPPVGTARGWIRVIDAASPTIGGYVGSAVATTQVLGVTSNKEMAFDIRSTTTPAHRNWHPEHNATGTMFDETPAAFYVDGEPVSAGAMAVNDSVPITDSFELVQHVRGKLVTPNTEVMEYRTRHTIGADGVLTFNGRGVCLAACEFVTGYPMMIPGHAPTGTNQFVSGILNTHTSPGDESTTMFAAEKDAVFSGAVVGSAVPNVIGAGTLLNPRLTFRRGKADAAPSGQQLYVWNRATYPKMYFTAFGGATLAPGDAYAWAFKLAVADIPNARALITT